MTEDERIRWHHQLNGHEFDQALRDDEGQERKPDVPIVHGVSKSQTQLSD